MQPTLGAELPAQCYVPAACDDISRIRSAYRFQRRQGSRIVAGERPPCGERAERRRVSAEPASGFSRIRSAIQCFQDRMNGSV